MTQTTSPLRALLDVEASASVPKLSNAQMLDAPENSAIRDIWLLPIAKGLNGRIDDPAAGWKGRGRPCVAPPPLKIQRKNSRAPAGAAHLMTPLTPPNPPSSPSTASLSGVARCWHSNAYFSLFSSLFFFDPPNRFVQIPRDLS